MIRNAAPLFLLPLLTLLAPACSSGGGNSGGDGTNTKTYTCLGTSVTASESNNYAFSSKMSLPAIKVQPKTELSFDWGSVTKDNLSHDVNAKTDLKMMSVIPFSLSPSELENKLNEDTLTMNDIVISPPLTIRTDGSTTTAKLFAFDLNGTFVSPDQIIPYFDPEQYPPANHVYALMAADSTEVGQGARKLQAFQLDPNSTNTDVKMTNASMGLTYSANLHDLTPTGIPKGQAAITLDWGDMTRNGMGRDFDPTQITRAIIGHYNETSGQLEKKFLDLELIATDLYEAQIEIGTSVDFSTMKTKTDNRSFAGIDDNGTWLVMLQCGVCRNPAPWYLSILKPCP